MSKTLWIVVGAIAVWWLFFRRSVAGYPSAGYRPPVPAPPSTGQQIAQGFVTVAPALGSFISNIARGFGPSSTGSSSSSDDYIAPSFSSTGSVSFGDDTLDYSF